jgi:hypothetical protein
MLNPTEGNSMHKSQRLINHVALVLDASYSMNGRQQGLVKAADAQIKHLALRSEEMSQETRVSVYRFGDATIECLIFDMDVMRLPSIADLYEVLYENTALLDATMKSQKDLETTSQLYGDHAFLTFVMTDGQENKSRNYRASDLSRHLAGADENWSIGFLVPDSSGVVYMERLGVLRDSIAVWDTASAAGVAQAASAIMDATDTFMTNRSKGVRGTRGVFSTGVDAVNKQTVKSTLTPLRKSKYDLFYVHAKSRIDETVQSHGLSYRAGMAYYQLTKKETIQATKNVIVVDKRTGEAYGGPEGRHLVGLPDGKSVDVSPQSNPQYDIFVQSTSFNRNLLPNTRLLVTY